MGTGSSRARKTRSCHCSPPRPWSGPRWGSGGSSAPAGHDTPGPRCSPASAFGEPDSDSELLDEVLAEFGDEKGAQLPPAPRPPPAHCRSRPAGGRGEGDGVHLSGQQVLLTGSTPESNNFANQLPLKKPELQATISYDYSEEELMATIEQEYCR
ncbi:cystin-1 [Tiliqua scincoides]|uniref:cystin-1 n=1 Tax=Tiliqua scincoides TaxID=71010 RepID=UPI003462FB86